MKALVLSGGGSKGAFQVGVLRSLLEQNPELDYDCYTGVSVGALNAALLATGPLNKTLPELEKIWLSKIKGNKSIWRHHLWRYLLIGICLIVLFIIAAFVSFILTAPKLLTMLFVILAIASFYVPYYSLNNTHAIYNNEPLRNLVNKYLDLSKLRQSGKKLRVGAVNFNTGFYGTGTEADEEIVEWIMASSSFPLFFPMEKINNHYWTDGGVVEITPLSDAINLGATEIDIIIATPVDPTYYHGHPGIPGQLLRNLNIMSAEVLRNDLNYKCKSKNIKFRIFMPEQSLTEKALSFEPKKLKIMYEKGKIIGEKVK